MYEVEGPLPNPAPQSRRSLGITAPQSPPLTPNLHGAPVSRSPCRARRCHRETPKSPGLDLAYLVVSAVLLPQPTAAQEANSRAAVCSARAASGVRPLGGIRPLGGGIGVPHASRPPDRVRVPRGARSIGGGIPVGERC